jgi:uncharacterized protein
MKDLVTNVIHQQKRELSIIINSYTITRPYEDQLLNSLDSPLVKVVTGPRRVGKSTLCAKVAGTRKYAYLNLEDERLPEIVDGDVLLSALDEAYPGNNLLFLDEIQNIPRWEQLLNRFLRLGRNVLVTGSNSQLLSDELASALTGRNLKIEVLPLGFQEIESFQPGLLKMNDYLIKGGFPEVVLGRADQRSYLSSLWDTVILRDIVQRKNVRNVSGLSSVLSLFLTGMTAKYSVSSLARSCPEKISEPSIRKFLNHAKDAYLISELELFHRKTRHRMKSDRKAYITDNGFFTAKTVGVSENSSVLLENAVFCELRRQGYQTDHSLFYYITRHGYEVDFLLREGHHNRMLIQVCYNLAALKTREREIRSLVEAAEELGLQKALIITWDHQESIVEKGVNIEMIPFQQWLMH